MHSSTSVLQVAPVKPFLHVHTKPPTSWSSTVHVPLFLQGLGLQAEFSQILDPVKPATSALCLVAVPMVEVMIEGSKN